MAIERERRAERSVRIEVCGCMHDMMLLYYCIACSTRRMLIVLGVSGGCVWHGWSWSMVRLEVRARHFLPGAKTEIGSAI